MSHLASNFAVVSQAQHRIVVLPLGYAESNKVTLGKWSTFKKKKKGMNHVVHGA